MDEEKALEQLDTLLEEISKIDAPSTQAEQKPLLSNIDILEQSISQKSSNNESTDGTKAVKETETHAENLKEIQVLNVSNEIKRENSPGNAEPLTSSSSEEKQSPRNKQKTKQDETMNKSSKSKETQKPSRPVSSKSASDARKGQTTFHQRSQTMKPSSSSPSSSSSSSSTTTTTTTKPTKSASERQKKPPSSSKSSAHLTRKTMHSSSSSSQLPKQISQSIKSQTLTPSKIKYEGKVTEKTLHSSQPTSRPPKEIERKKSRYIDDPTQVPDPVRIKKPVREIPETSINPLPSILTIDLPDGNQKKVCTTPDFTVQELFDLVCDKLDLWQNDLFCLVQTTLSQPEQFLLQPKRTLKDENITPETKLKLKVLWWKTPFKWVDPVALHFFYHEAKGHIINGDWPCSESAAIRLAAIQMQITYGDLTKSRLQVGFLNDQMIVNFLPPYVIRSMQNIYAQQRIFFAYSKLQGFSTQDAQRLYLEEAKKCPTYGTTIFRGYYEARFDRKLGIGEEGVFVQQEDESKWEFFHYRDLQDVSVMETGIKFVFKTASFFHKIGGGVPNTILSLVSGYYWILLKQETPGIVKKEFIHAPPVTPNYLYLRRPHPKDPIPTSNLLVWKAHYLNRCKERNITPSNKFMILLDNAADTQQRLEYIHLPKSKLNDDQLELIVTSLEMTLRMTPDPLIRNDVAFEIVNVAKNNLSVGRTVGTLLTLSKVKYADLSKNRLGSSNAPDGLAAMLNRGNVLETFILSGNHLGNDGTKILMQALKGSPTLRSLGLANNEITAEFCHYLAKYLKSNNTLTSLNLADNNLEEGMKELMSGLSQNASLQVLDISNVGMTGKASSLLAEWASTNLNLLSLKVSYNNFPSSSVSSLAKCATNNLVCFHVHKTNIGTTGTKAIIDFLPNNYKLKELYLGGNFIDKKGIAALCDVLKQNNTLQKLSLRDSDLPKEGLITLGQVLQLNTGLQMLDLSENKRFSNKEVVTQWATTLQKNTGLIELNISSVGLDKTSVAIFSSGLRTNNKLEILRLDGNKIGHEGMKELATNLKNNKKLKILKIQDADLTVQDVLDFLSALGKDSALEVLNVKKNNNLIKNSKTLKENIGKYNYIKVSY